MDPKEVREELFLLKKRWNRGEITREEYIAEKAEFEALLRDLGEAPPATTPPSPAVRPVQSDARGLTISGGATQAPSGPAGATISGPAGGTESPLSSVPTNGRPAAGIQAPAGELPLGGLFAGKYRIEKKLGAGGMGVTYKALDEVRGQAVCLKVIRPELAADEGMARRFIHEANAGMKLSHENFVRIHDANVAEGRLFIAMEYVEGTPMRDWMKGFAKRREEVPAEQAVEVARQILLPMCEAHEKEIVHRDLKPENVMFIGKPGEKGFRVEVLDFGIAKVAGATVLTREGARLGTPEYMAPEQKTSAETAGPAADVYALGAMLYEMLVGVAPEGVENPSEEREDCPEWLSQAVVKCLARNPRRRFGSARELLDALDAERREADRREKEEAEKKRREEAERRAQEESEKRAKADKEAREKPWREAMAVGKAAEERKDWEKAEGAYRRALEAIPGEKDASDAAARVEAARKQGALPDGFQAPSGDRDHVGNPVVVRGGKKADPATGLAFEIQLHVPHAPSPVPPISFVLVPAGEFMMGSPDSEAERSPSEGPVHRVRFAKPFYMGKYAVTQGQWEAVMGSNPSHFTAAGKDAPVEQVSWNDCKEYIAKLNELCGSRLQAATAGAGGRGQGAQSQFRLPSEAEWEYACRAGTRTPFHFGATITPEQVNYDGNYPYGKASKGKYRQTTVRVGSLQPNAWGVYEMHGNVWEWCEDLYHDDYTGAPEDGSPWLESGSGRVLRGGSWHYVALICRSAGRYRFGPSFRIFNLGFRLVLSPRIRISD